MCICRPELAHSYNATRGVSLLWPSQGDVQICHRPRADLPCHDGHPGRAWKPLSCCRELFSVGMLWQLVINRVMWLWLPNWKWRRLWKMSVRFPGKLPHRHLLPSLSRSYCSLPCCRRTVRLLSASEPHCGAAALCWIIQRTSGDRQWIKPPRRRRRRSQRDDERS